MKRTPAKKKRNPTDSTLRNVRAAKKRDATQAERLTALLAANDRLNQALHAQRAGFNERFDALSRATDARLADLAKRVTALEERAPKDDA